MAHKLLVVLLLICCLAYCCTGECLTGNDEECCRKSLRMGQYYCTSPVIDEHNQSEAGCSREGRVKVPCFAAPNVNCSCGKGAEYNMSQCVFQREQPCRFVEGQRYNYRVAVALSLFLGMFGIDRFYLGYPAIGLLKFCTFGFFLIGHLIDFLLILVQVVGPADRTSYYAPFYGPLLTEVNTTGVLVTEGILPPCST